VNAEVQILPVFVSSVPRGFNCSERPAKVFGYPDRMALERRNWRTLEEIVCSLSEEELIDFSRARAQRESDSSSYEGIPLDTEELFRQYLELYRRWRTESALTPY
jgi:hypothetical protein